MEEGPDRPGEMRQITARPLQTMDLGFSVQFPPSHFPYPSLLSTVKKGFAVSATTA